MPALAAALLMACAVGSDGPGPFPGRASKPAAKPASTATTNPAAKAIGQQVREAVEAGIDPNKQVTLMVDGKEKRITPSAAAAPRPAAAGHSAAARPMRPRRSMVAAPGAIPNPVAARQQAARARAAAVVGHSAPAAAGGEHGGEVHWSYEGEAGPQSWGKLKPEFNVCAIGKRQSPSTSRKAPRCAGRPSRSSSSTRPARPAS